MAESAIVRGEMNIAGRLVAGLSIAREEHTLEAMRRSQDGFRERLALLEALYAEG